VEVTAVGLMNVRRLRVLLVILAGAMAVLLARQQRKSAAEWAIAAWSDAEPSPEPLPIAQYDDLRAVDIAATIRTLDDSAEIQQVLDYEEAHNQRVTVIRAAKARLRALEAAKEPVDA
jgi:hypothetical protein